MDEVGRGPLAGPIVGSSYTEVRRFSYIKFNSWSKGFKKAKYTKTRGVI